VHLHVKNHAAFLKRVAADINQIDKVVVRLHAEEDITVGELHDFRVGLRRLQASAYILRGVGKSEGVESVLDMIATVLAETGKIRDEQVLSKAIPAKLRTSDYNNWLRKRARTHVSSDMGVLRLVGATLPYAFKRSMSGLIVNPISEVAEKKLFKRIEKLIGEDCMKLKIMASRIQNEKSTLKSLHKFRVRAKRLRYVLELVRPELGSKSIKVQNLVEKVQTSFGQLHDLDTAMSTLNCDANEMKKKARNHLLKKIKVGRVGLLAKAFRAAQTLEGAL
jgi:CHAD domain-containing protein